VFGRPTPSSHQDCAIRRDVAVCVIGFTDREIIKVQDYTVFLRSFTVLQFPQLLCMCVAKILAYLEGRRKDYNIYFVKSLALVSFPQTVWNSAYIITLHALSPKTMSLDPLFYFALASGSVSIPVAARSKAWYCGPSLVGFACSNPARVMDVCMSLVNVLCCQLGVLASSWPLVRMNPTECGVSEWSLNNGEAVAHY